MDRMAIYFAVPNYRGITKRLYFLGDAAFANPDRNSAWRNCAMRCASEAPYRFLHLRYSQITKPLVIRRDHIPRRVASAGGIDRVLERRDVIVPQRPLEIVGLADLPVPLRILQPLGKARELFFLADIQEEFQDRGAIVGQPGLELTDAFVAGGPSRLVDQLVHPRHQHVLVVGPVEDSHLSASGHTGGPARGNHVRAPLAWAV